MVWDISQDVEVIGELREKRLISGVQYEKHKGEDPATLREPYYPSLRQYSLKGGSAQPKSKSDGVSMFMLRYGKKVRVSRVYKPWSFCFSWICFHSIEEIPTDISH